METHEEKFDLIENKYTKKIKYYKTEEERDKKAKEMLDKAKEILESNENHHYKTLKYILSKLTWEHDGKTLNENELEKYNTHSVRPDASMLAFKFPEQKGNWVEAFDIINSDVLESKGNLQNLYEPLPIRVDYDEYSNETFFKNDMFAKRYKDGLLLVYETPRNLRKVVQTIVLKKEIEEIKDITKLLTISECTLRLNCGIDFNDECFKDKITLYIIDKSVHKTKGIKINLKNTFLNKNIEKVKNFKIEPPHIQAGIEKIANKRSHVLFNNFFRLLNESQNFVETLFTYKNAEYATQDIINKYCKYVIENNSKKDLLRIGWKMSLRKLYKNINSINSRFKDPLNFFSGLVEFSSEEQTKNLEWIFENQNKYNSLLSHLTVFDGSKPSEKTIEQLNFFLKYSMLKATKFLFDTNEGMSLFTREEIDITEMTKTDCFLFWQQIELYDLLFFNNKRCPLVLRDGKVLNDLEINSEEMKNYIFKEGLSEYTVDYVIEDYNFSNKHLLKEAMEQSTGYCFHETGFFPIIPSDTIFKGLRFKETSDSIWILLLDKNERFMCERFDKNKCDFVYSLYRQFKLSKEYLNETMDHIYNKITDTIRDFKIIKNRDKVLDYTGRRIPRGMNTNTKYEVFLPRYRYKRNPKSKEQQKREKEFETHNKNFVGSRTDHFRKLPDGYQASKVQMLLAKKLGKEVMPGYTYVRESKYGEDGQSKREIIYRSKSLHGTFYYTKTEKSEFEKISEMSSPGFEEYCHGIIAKNGWKVYKNNPIDGGIDIRALKEDEKGNIRTLLVQCKMWRTPIPPGAIRDFKAGCDEEKVDGTKELMFMAFSKFSPGAVEYANKYNIVLVDGDQLINKNVKYN